MKRSDIETNYISDNLIIFKTTCQCQHNSITIIIDKLNENDTNPICEMYFDTYWNSNNGILIDSPWYYKLWHNIKQRTIACLKIIFTGNLECSDGFIFKDKEHINSLLTALKEALATLSK